MLYVGLNISGKSLVAYAVTERKQRVYDGEVAPTRAGLRALMQRVGRARSWWPSKPAIS
ncbi:hypothetical protein [Nitrospira sp. Kam-Ns4a]